MQRINNDKGCIFVQRIRKANSEPTLEKPVTSNAVFIYLVQYLTTKSSFDYLPNDKNLKK